MRIRIQIQGFDDQEFEKFPADIKIIFFWSKISIYLSRGLHKDVQANRRSLRPSNSNT